VNNGEHEDVIGAPIAGVHAVPRGLWVCFKRPGDGLSAPILLEGDDVAFLRECTSLLPLQTHGQRLAAGGFNRRLLSPSASARRGHAATASRMSNGPAGRNRTRRLSNDGAEARVRLLAARGCFLSRSEIISNLRSGAAPQDNDPSQPVRVVVRDLSRLVRRRLVSFLVEAGVEERTARFALEGGTGSRGLGADRNLALLLSAGRRAILTDAASAVAPPTEPDQRDLMLHGAFDPCDYCWEDRRGRSTEPADEEQLGQAISAVLGRRLGVVVADCGGRVELCSNFTPPALDSLTTFGSSLRISAVIPGLHGCGRVPLLSWLRSVGTSGATGLASTVDLRDGQRRCVRRTPGMVVSLGTYFDGACFGFDNRALSVPFHPDAEDCDDLFGLMLRQSAPDTCTAHVPELALADHVEVASPDVRWILTQVRPGIGRLTGDVVGRTQPVPGSANVDDWCVCTGAALEAVADARREDFLELAYECAHSYWCTAYQQIAALLDGPERPLKRESRALIAIRDELRRLLTVPLEAVPGSLTGGAHPDHRIDAARSSTASFARLLQAWPAMWTAAAGLTDRERELLAGRHE
jgi:hypothetical protein